MVVGSAKTIRHWDVATWRELVSFRGHLEPVISLAFTPDGKLLASGDWAGTLLLWDVARAVLGHSSPVVTEVYAELDGEKAIAAMERIG